MSDCFIGLMSGTSLDGVDAVLAEWPEPPSPGAPTAPPRVLAHHHQPFAPALQAELLALNARGADELHRGALAANGVARAYAAATAGVLAASGRAPGGVRAVGAHGQTVRHQPGAFDGTGYTLQLLNGALLAEACGIDVVCDFRSRDVAAGGQGAPLVPAAHDDWFAEPKRAVGVLNLGGIANWSLLPARQPIAGRPPARPPVRGFDCGPANLLLDGWCQRHRGEPYDADGRWAASGTVDAALLARLQREPFLQAAPPKSTGRDLFSLAWLDAQLGAHRDATGQTPRPADVQATLAAFTVACAAEALLREAPQTEQVIVCGGGARNGALMAGLGQALAPRPVVGSDALGWPCQQIEALAFAWLARQFVRRAPGNLPAVTGARGPRVLGALHPA